MTTPAAGTAPNSASANIGGKSSGSGGGGPTDPVTSFIEGLLGITGTDANSWLGSLAGQIASGLEASFVSLLTGLWNVIIGPLEIMAGVAIAVLILLWAFKDDISQAAQMIIPFLL